MRSSEGFVTADDGVRLFFQKAGSGPQTVIVPYGTLLMNDFAPLATRRTFIFYDQRNRGRSDAVTDRSKIERGIEHDLDDLDALRRHFGLGRVDLLGHSYAALVLLLYAIRRPEHVGRVAAIGAMAPDQSTQYPAHLTGADAVLTDVLARLGQLQQERQSHDPVEFCRRFWAVLKPLYVANPADAEKITWDRCDLPNERNFMKPWLEHVLPSIQRTRLSARDLAPASMPILVVHGTRDRSAPYGGARDWALNLPNARLLTVKDVAHAPWIESPETVFSALDAFLDGSWPEAAERVTVLDPGNEPSQAL